MTLAAASQASGVFNFTGTLDLQSGVTLGLTGGGAFSGTFTEEAGSELDIEDGTFEAEDGTSFVGAGNVMEEADPQGGQLQNPLVDVPAGATVTAPVGNFTLGRRAQIAGAGTFIIPAMGTLTWSGGAMTGTGTTDIAQGAVVNALYDITPINLGPDRTFDNNGTFNWFGSTRTDPNTMLPNSFTMEGWFNNNGIFNINSVNSSVPYIDGPGLFTNSFFGQIRQLGGATQWGVNLNNFGPVTVDAGQLLFSGSARRTVNNTGGMAYFQAAAGATVQFEYTTVTYFSFLPLAVPDTSNLFRGEGNYVINTGGTMIVQAGTIVTAVNFELRSGTLRGPGTFAAMRFDWTGGKMTTENVGSSCSPSNKESINTTICSKCTFFEAYNCMKNLII